MCYEEVAAPERPGACKMQDHSGGNCAQKKFCCTNLSDWRWSGEDLSFASLECYNAFSGQALWHRRLCSRHAAVVP